MTLALFFGAVTILTYISVNAGVFGIGSDRWKEEVLLHNGQRIIVTRTVKRGGRHEIGQRPPYKEQKLSFTLPDTGASITWEDHFSKDLGMANFLPMLLDIVAGTPYLVVSPMGCLSYNKWGRPNPPYVVFKYQQRGWIRIPLQELPNELTMPNVVVSSPDDVAKRTNGWVSSDEIKKANSGFKQPKYRTILREPMAKERIDQMCIEMIHYKCGWISPHGTFGREFMDSICK
ncbi:MAG: hypothetical protein LBR95_03295 [Azoarcus sp.]|jgi:hypothetical protein|nr:hypothetical protein [Azoarcus sp.]